jgi:hypothetical protein
MLLAGREGEDEAALPFRVDGLAGKPPGHLPHIFLTGCEEPHIRPAEVEPDADRLAFADDDVRAHLAGRADRAQGDRLGHHRDQQSAGLMAARGELRQIGDPAEDVGILDDDAARLPVRLDRADAAVASSFGGS